MKIIKITSALRFSLMLLLLTLTGCAKGNDKISGTGSTSPETSESINQTVETVMPTEETEAAAEPVITETDWSDYFQEINGAAVIYDPAENGYRIYNRKLSLSRHSPCSTFKIISSLTGIKNGIIQPEHSTRTWSGEIFWNEDWNKDIDFSDAFHTSCVWYFREVIDEIGKTAIQEELNNLQYGNCDISDWEGKLNTNNSNPALTGFWIESSLLISPKEQTEVMERIFGDNQNYAEDLKEQLKQVMLISDPNESDILIYGKTGMGKSHGVVVDSWFTGFADSPEKRIYFCVYWGKTENKNVSSARAREIALEIIPAYLKERNGS